MLLSEILTKGGPVVIILVAYSVIALAIVLERMIHFFRMGRVPSDFEAALTRQGMAFKLAGQRGPEVAVVHALQQAAAEGVADLARVAERVAATELQRMQRGFATLAMLGNTAPLWGLFGTITGMISAFMVIEQAGGKVDAQALAGGIWEAMVTTGVGLAVALPILLLLHMLEGWAIRRAEAMQRVASLLLERVAAPQLSHPANPEMRHPNEVFDAA
jgi:biopolymer transport protein ExbB